MRALDLVIVFGYLAGVVAAGAFFARRQKTTAQYFLGGRHVPWWAISASIVATETSTITFISVPGIIYREGGDFGFLQLVFGYLLGRVVISALLIPAYFRRELLTVYELLQSRFGRAVKALAAALFVLMRTVADGVRLLLTAFVLAAVFAAFSGSAGVETAVVASILLLGSVMILFTFFGGMEAVIWIEVVQLGIYVDRGNRGRGRADPEDPGRLGRGARPRRGVREAPPLPLRVGLDEARSPSGPG